MKTVRNYSTDYLLGASLTALVSEANKIRTNLIGNKLELCSILNAKSGSCSEDCKFCSQSAWHSTGINTYALKDKNKIIRAARRAKRIGAERFDIVTSGNRLSAKEIENIAQAVAVIKKDVGINICASLGALKKQELKILKISGVSRYHHNIETSPRFYPQIVSTHTFQERVKTIEAAVEVGLEVCSGGIIGMGENWQDRIDMAHWLRKLGVRSVPINFLIPIPGTPLESLEQISFEEALRTICIFRIILKDKIIKIAAGRESVLKEKQSLGFLAGANGMLIGGYLTVKGDSLKADYELIKEIKRLWRE
jgi:biotin synthase